jgi:hypothetical protein
MSLGKSVCAADFNQQCASARAEKMKFPGYCGHLLIYTCQQL